MKGKRGQEGLVRHTWLGVGVLVVVLIMFALAAGCASSEDTTGTTSTDTTTAETGDTVTTSGAPAAPTGSVVISAGTDPASLDPMKASVPHPEMSIVSHIFDYLVWTTPDMKIEPMLAESWSMVDETTWEFKLRQDVTFSNGEVFDANSVKYTIERALDPEVQASDRTVAFISLDNVEIVDPYTVVIHTTDPVPSMLLRLSFLAMLPPKYYAETPLETLAQEPIGSGPYALKEWVKNDHVTLEAREGYWGRAALIEELVFRPVPESGTVLAELLSAGVDIAPNIPPDDIVKLKQQGVAVLQQPGARRMMVGFNYAADTPVRDKLVRQAMNYAIDVDTIAKTLLGGIGSKSFNLIWPEFADPSIKPYPYDLEKAKSLLKEAGYEDGFTVAMQYPPGRYVRNNEIAQAIANDLAKVNITIELKPTDMGTLVPAVLEKKTDPLVFLGLSDLFDPVYDLTVLDRTYAFSCTDWVNDEYQTNVELLQKTMDPQKQQELSYKLQHIAYDEAAWIFLYWNPDIYAKSNNVDGFAVRADEQIILRDAWANN